MSSITKQQGWVGVDLDGSLAYLGPWQGIGHVGEPIPLMVARVRAWLAQGIEVRIFTARVSPVSMAANGNTLEETVAPIQAWCLKYLGKVLPITCEKDMMMLQCWDDRAVQLICNTGLRADQEDN